MSTTMSDDATDSNSKMRDAFVAIYASHEWEGRSHSGPGSDLERTAEFRAFLSEFCRTNNIKSVLDMGCGDWSYARAMDWTGIDYLGVDVVPDVVSRNQREFGIGNVRFMCIEPTAVEVPAADLFLCKEVLQHLPNQRVHDILGMARAFKYAIFVNDVQHQVRGGFKEFWRWRDVSETNVDIPAGGYRLLSLRDPPFQLDAIPRLVYPNKYSGRRWIKEVLVWTRIDLR